MGRLIVIACGGPLLVVASGAFARPVNEAHMRQRSSSRFSSSFFSLLCSGCVHWLVASGCARGLAALGRDGVAGQGYVRVASHIAPQLVGMGLMGKYLTELVAMFVKGLLA